MKLHLILGLTSVLLISCSPSQEQVDMAVEKEMKRREEEKQRVYKYIDEYSAEKGGGGGPQAQRRPMQPSPSEPSIEDQLKNPKKPVDAGDSPTKGARWPKITIYEFS